MKKPFVYNEKGYLLLEHLLAMFVVGILVLTFVPLLTVITTYESDVNALTMHEVNTLAIRLQNEVRGGSHLKPRANGISVYFAPEGTTVSFFVQNNRLMRQVDGRGGEILHYHIRHLDASLATDTNATLALTSLTGEVFAFGLHIFDLTIPSPKMPGGHADD